MAEREPYPSEKQDRFIVRLPDGMRDRIKAVATMHNRSMNAEIISVLEEAFPPLSTALEHQLTEALRVTRDALYSTDLTEDQKDDLWGKMMTFLHTD
ncbi:Arc family DNA-binding protein [Paracoccus sp. (in: a-proteobacteria)]|uniref:Arc family DNA-binding protein n=1 Tax=Paracoccus sp. TaxID=267 RepID=UPI0028A6E6A8|nr:Arc family DNA-binding protein [Paracoccus sp. (in: a-proteobacteria)]